jgi:dTDP-4-amino-4,6-dideoxygalactose transaminase
MTEWQGAVLRAQLERFPAQQAVRSANADFLNAALSDIPGITPQGRHSGCTSQGNYCYVVKFDSKLFPDRDRLRTALRAEGMPLTTGYPPMHRLEMFGGEGGLGPRLRDTSAYPAYSREQMPVAEELSKATIWFKTAVLMGSRQDAQSVVDAVAKVHRCAADIAHLQPTEY